MSTLSIPRVPSSTHSPRHSRGQSQSHLRRGRVPSHRLSRRQAGWTSWRLRTLLSGTPPPGSQRRRRHARGRQAHGCHDRSTRCGTLRRVLARNFFPWRKRFKNRAAGVNGDHGTAWLLDWELRDGGGFGPNNPLPTRTTMTLTLPARLCCSSSGRIPPRQARTGPPGPRRRARGCSQSSLASSWSTRTPRSRAFRCISSATAREPWWSVRPWNASPRLDVRVDQVTYLDPHDFKQQGHDTQ